MGGPTGLAAIVLVVALLVPGAPPTDEAASGVRTPPPPASVAFSGTADGPVVISRVYANAARDDEFIELASLELEVIDLGGWSLSDREATATFPPESWLLPGARLVATRNATSYAEDTLASADFTYDLGEAMPMEGGILRLADTGDEVLLLDPTGAVVDAFVYGDSAYSGDGWEGPPARAQSEGHVAVRASLGGIPIDRDSREDWDGMRSERLGQSAFEFGDLASSAAARAILSPEDGRDAILSLIASGIATIDVSVYTLTSEAIAAGLSAAAARGVRVRVLLDGSPVGGVEADGKRLAGALAHAGAEVRWLLGGADIVKRYRYLHAKYAIVDGQRVLVSSENFGDAGFPVPGGSGNRGWSIVLEDETLATEIGRVFESDFDPRRRDSVAVEPIEDVLGPPPPAPPWAPGATAGRRLRLVIAPDTVLEPGGVLGLLASAMDSIWIEAFYLEETWGDVPNPFLEAAFDAARRGVRVRILLDGSWWNTDPGTAGNDDVAAALNARAAAEALDLEVRLVEPMGRIERVHNKGLVVDSAFVFVSSMNWANASATENREVGLILEDPALAATFERALLADWVGLGGVADLRIEDPAAVAAIYIIVAAAAVASLYTMRRTSKGLKPPAPMESRGRAGTHLRRGRGEVRILPTELVAQPRARARGRSGDRRGREEARSGLGGSEGD